MDPRDIVLRTRVRIAFESSVPSLPVALRRALPTFTRVRFVADQRDIPMIPAAVFIIPAIESLTPAQWQTHGILARVLERGPGSGIVLVTPDVPQSSAALASTAIRTVDLDRLDHQLEPAVRAVAAEAFLQQMQHEIDSNRTVGAVACSILTRICMSVPPPTTVSGAAALIGRKASTAADQWTRSDIASRCPRFKHAFDWILLFRAVAAKDASASWRQVAASLGVSLMRLISISRRFTGRTVAHLFDDDDFLTLAPFRTPSEFFSL